MFLPLGRAERVLNCGAVSPALKFQVCKKKIELEVGDGRDNFAKVSVYLMPQNHALLKIRGSGVQFYRLYISPQLKHT